jgi:hypothetical protein
MNGEQVKTWGVLTSPLLAIAGLAWAVSSWRRAGSRLRIHALLYREVLVLWVFNAGRTTDQVERIVLGGRRGGIDGLELTKDLGAPIKLAPGESWRHEFRWKSAVPEDRHGMLSGGWESVWLLLGSMRQRRVEVTAVGEDYPPRVGWRLAPRGVGITRYLPLAALIPLTLVTAAAPRQHVYGAYALTALWGLVAVRLFMVSGYEPARRRVERWAVAAVAAVATFIWIAKANASNSDWAPWTNYIVIGVGAALAWPGGIATVHREVGRRMNSRKRRRALR